MFKHGDMIRQPGQSGKTYDFEMTHYPLRVNLPPIKAVYIVENITFKPGDPLPYQKQIFVGSTDNLFVAFTNHPKAKLFEQHNANCVCVLPVLDPGAREIICLDVSGKLPV